MDSGNTNQALKLLLFEAISAPFLYARQDIKGALNVALLPIQHYHVGSQQREQHKLDEMSQKGMYSAPLPLYRSQAAYREDWGDLCPLCISS